MRRYGYIPRGRSPSNGRRALALACFLAAGLLYWNPTGASQQQQRIKEGLVVGAYSSTLIADDPIEASPEQLERLKPSRGTSGACDFRLKGTYVFPIPPRFAYNYVDTWLGERPQGGGDGGNQHLGTDIFAERGTPLVAVTNGTIGPNFGNDGGLGGNRLWIHGSDGVNYYYAHLDGFAKGIGPGTKVRLGQVVGYIGNTGAQGTPPHLHLSMSTGEYTRGQLFNPFPCILPWDPKR